MIFIPKYKYLGCGDLTSRTAKSGNQYLSRCIFVAPYKDDGSLASSANVFLIGSSVDLFDPAKVKPGADLFLDFNHKGYLVDLRIFKVPEG